MSTSQADQRVCFCSEHPVARRCGTSVAVYFDFAPAFVLTVVRTLLMCGDGGACALRSLSFAHSSEIETPALTLVSSSRHRQTVCRARSACAAAVCVTGR